MSNLKFETIALHGGYNKEKNDGTISVPVYRTAAYHFKSVDEGADLFALKKSGFIYTRIGNPTQEVLESRLAALEGGASALALSSGTSAIFYAIINICTMGDEFLASSNLYGGTYTMFNDILPTMGINVKFFDPSKPEEIESMITEKTKAVYLESLDNPSLVFPNVKAYSKITKKHNLPLIVDNTFLTPYLFRPIEHGADIVVHSLTKWIGGQGSSIGGIVIDSGKFNWKDEKFTLYNKPDSSYHDIRFAHDLGDLSHLAFILRMRLVALRNLGGAITPDNSWFFLQGLETLSLRMEKHCSNARKVAEFLEGHDKIAWVNYPGSSNHKDSQFIADNLPDGAGGMLVFGVKGGYEKCKKFIDSLNLIVHCANVGDSKTLIIHPASTTHSQLKKDALESAGIAEDMIRCSVGIENPDDIIDDMKQALKNI